MWGMLLIRLSKVGRPTLNRWRGTFPRASVLDCIKKRNPTEHKIASFTASWLYKVTRAETSCSDILNSGTVNQNPPKVAVVLWIWNVPQGHLITWSLVMGLICRGDEEVPPCWSKHVTWGDPWEFKAHSPSDCFLLPVFGSCSATMPASCHSSRPGTLIPLELQANVNILFPESLWVMVFCHSSGAVTNTVAFLWCFITTAREITKTRIRIVFLGLPDCFEESANLT